MLHDLYLMSANPSLEAASRRNYEHRTLSFTEMATSCTRREATPRNEKRASGVKSLTALLLQGVRA